MSLNLEKITFETIDTAKTAATIIKNSLLNKEKIQSIKIFTRKVLARFPMR